MRIISQASGEISDFDDEEIVIGSSEGCDCRIPGAASVHARLRPAQIEAIADCTVGGVKLPAGAKRRIVPGIEIEVEGTRLRVEKAAPNLAAVSTRRLALDLVRGPSIVVVEGANAGEVLSLSMGVPFIIGRRDGDARLRLDDPDVSRDHVEIVFAEDTVLVRDLGSRRGTRLGRHLLSPQRKAVWTPAKMLQVGKNIFALVLPDVLHYREELAKADVLEDAPSPVAAAAAPRPEEASPPDGPDVVEVVEEEPAPVAAPGAEEAGECVEVDPAPSAPAPIPPVRDTWHVTALTVGVLLLVATAVALVAVVGVWVFTSSLPRSSTDEVLGIVRSSTLPLRGGA